MWDGSIQRNFNTLRYVENPQEFEEPEAPQNDAAAQTIFCGFM
jgi:hypothetical protein